MNVKIQVELSLKERVPCNHNHPKILHVREVQDYKNTGHNKKHEKEFHFQGTNLPVHHLSV